MPHVIKRESLANRSISVSNYNKLVDSSNGNNFCFDRNQFNTIVTPNGVIVSLVKNNSGSRSSNSAFDYSINGASFTVRAGKFIVDGRGMFSVAETPVTVTGGTSSVPHWIFMRASRSSPSPEIVYQASAPNPASNSDFEFPLYSVGLESGTAVIYNIWHRGANIIVGAAL